MYITFHSPQAKALLMRHYFTATILILFSLSANAQSVINPKDAGKLFIKSFSESDFTALEKQCYGPNDSLGRSDCYCMKSLKHEIRNSKTVTLNNLFKTHIKFLEEDINLDELNFEGAILEKTFEEVRLLVATSYQGLFFIFNLRCIPTNNGLKLFKDIKLKTDEYSLKKHFNITGVKTLNFKKGHKLFITPNKDIQYKTSKGSDKQGSFLRHDYYNTDTLVATLYAYQHKHQVKFDEYYRNGRINYSRLVQFASKKDFKQCAKKHTNWVLLKETFNNSELIHFMDFYENGMIEHEKQFFQDSIIETDGYFNGRISKQIVKDKNQNTIRKCTYNFDGTIQSYKTRKQNIKINSIAELNTYPTFPQVAKHYYSPFYAVRPEPKFHRKPDGWYVEVDRKYLNNAPEIIAQIYDSTQTFQFLFWSFQKQEYEKLPSNVFNQGHQRIKYSFQFIPDYNLYCSKYTGFSGYPHASEDFKKLIENDPNHSPEDYHLLQIPIFRILNTRLNADDFSVTEESKKLFTQFAEYTRKINSFKNCNDSTKNSLFHLTAELYQKLKAHTNQATAKSLLVNAPPSKSLSLFLQAELLNMGGNSVYYSTNTADIQYYTDLQNTSAYSFVNLNLLQFHWYRNFLEKNFSEKIFKLDDKFYHNSNSNLWHACDNGTTPSLKEYLGMIQNSTENCSGYVVNIKLLNISERISDLDNCHIYMQPLEFELLEFIANQSSKSAIVSPEPYFALQNNETPFLLYRYCVSENCTSINADSIIKPVYEQNFHADDPVRKKLFKNIALYCISSNDFSDSLYKQAIDFYSKNYTNELYQLAVDFVLKGFQINKEKLAIEMLEKCMVYNYDFCLEYYQKNKIVSRGTSKLKQYLKTVKPDLYQRYFEIE